MDAVAGIVLFLEAVIKEVGVEVDEGDVAGVGYIPEPFVEHCYLRQVVPVGHYALKVDLGFWGLGFYYLRLFFLNDILFDNRIEGLSMMTLNI